MKTTFFALLTTCVLLLLATTPGRSVQPYQPAYSDPVEETWRWRHYPELGGLGLHLARGELRHHAPEHSMLGGGLKQVWRGAFHARDV